METIENSVLKKQKAGRRKSRKLLANKGQIVVDSDGYQLVNVGEAHKLADKRGYVLGHHLNWFSHYGSLPPKGYVIHHVNGNKLDNRIENLESVTLAEHALKHPKKRNKKGQFMPEPVR